jgi:hypothetical protein
MGHAFPDIESRIDASGHGAFKVTARVVEQDFVTSDMDAYRWQSSQALRAIPKPPRLKRRSDAQSDQP